MCLIIDANFIHRVYPLPDADGLPIERALVSHRARLVYGGELAREYGRMTDFRRRLVGLDRAGVARKIPDAAVDHLTKQLGNASAMVSDDPHIIALAQVSGARLLCSNDGDLHSDFTNHAFLNNPRGRVYQTANHAPLIKEHCAHVRPDENGDPRPRRRPRRRRGSR